MPTLDRRAFKWGKKSKDAGRQEAAQGAFVLWKSGHCPMEDRNYDLFVQPQSQTPWSWLIVVTSRDPGISGSLPTNLQPQESALVLPQEVTISHLRRLG